MEIFLFLIKIITIIMIVCLTCSKKYKLNLGSNLIEAFQHLHHKFLVCRKCFCEFIRTYNINTFNRISLLRNQMYKNIKINIDLTK
jgi:hypothetical protein